MSGGGPFLGVDGDLAGGPVATGAGSLTGLAGFLRPGALLDMTVVLVVALGLGAVIAYHPSTGRKAATLAELEQPKTIVLYALVAAVVAQVVVAEPAMALVVFGIGGLLRFRTDVGEAKDTGRVILVTVVGLSSGLRLYVVAVLATVIGWLVIALLERRSAGRVRVRGLDDGGLAPAAEAYRAALVALGCAVLREKRNVAKGQVSLVFRAPARLDRDDLEAAFERLPEAVRGAPDIELA